MSPSTKSTSLVALFLCVLSSDAVVQVRLRQKEKQQQAQQQQKGDPPSALHADGFVRALEFQHQLRVCNAYPYAAALSIYRGKSEQLTGDAPMPYKSCRDFKAPLIAGDKLEFKIGDVSAGTFSVSDLPNNDAVLLLVIHRHDTLSTAVAFESHVFASVDNAQVAVIDTYKGAAKGMPKIMDDAAFVATPSKDNKAGTPVKPSEPRSEELRYDSVVAVNPGVYDVVLDDDVGQEKARSKLVALKHESYVVLRTGVESKQGPGYPQELIIFPNPDSTALRSTAPKVWGTPWAALQAFLIGTLGAAVVA